jgi:hypothetical protein
VINGCIYQQINKRGNIMTFKPGASGNPQGRPAGAPNKRTQLIKLLEPHAAALINKCVELALGGDAACLRLALDKLLPRAKDQAVNINLPAEKTSAESLEKLGENIFRQLENGDLTPNQARSLFDVIKSYRNITPEHDSRPTSLIEMIMQKNKRLESP